MFSTISYVYAIHPLCNRPWRKNSKLDTPEGHTTTMTMPRTMATMQELWLVVTLKSDVARRRRRDDATAVIAPKPQSGAEARTVHAPCATRVVYITPNSRGRLGRLEQPH